MTLELFKITIVKVCRYTDNITCEINKTSKKYKNADSNHFEWPGNNLHT